MTANKVQCWTFLEGRHFFILLFYLCSYLFMFVHREKLFTKFERKKFVENFKNQKRHRQSDTQSTFFAIPFKGLQSWIHLNFQVPSLVSRNVNDSAVTIVEIIFNPSLKLIIWLLYVELILEIITASIWKDKKQIFILHRYHKEPDQAKQLFMAKSITKTELFRQRLNGTIKWAFKCRNLIKEITKWPKFAKRTLTTSKVNC